ncbi:MAG: Uma2 family endonuclease [Gemmatimonadaceae bacterium]
MPATKNDWTVEMLDALPDDGRRYEIIDGELFVTPSPGEAHQDAVLFLVTLVDRYLRGRNVGKVMMSPSDVRRGDRTRNRIQPDIYVVRLTEGARPQYPYDVRDLLLAIEVLSPGSARLDKQTKRELYLREGVGEYWMVDPKALTVSRWSGIDDAGEILSKELRWHPAGMKEPLVLNLPEFFVEAFR